MQRWIQYQRIGLVTYVVQALPAIHIQSEKDIFAPALKLLLDYVSKAGHSPRERSRFFNGCPPSILHLLYDLSNMPKTEGCLSEVREEALKAIQTLLSPSENQGPPLYRAQIWAWHALRARSAPVALVRLGKDWLHWAKDMDEKEETLAEMLTEPLAILRNPWSGTTEKCNAVTTMTTIFGFRPWWGQIENFLYHHLFAWPLLVSKGLLYATSLPMSVDIQFPQATDEDDDFSDKAFSRMKHGKCVKFLHGKGVISVERWKNHFEYAARLGKQLWRQKHGNFGSFRRKIKWSEVSFDFREAQMIADDLGRIGSESLSLQEGSAIPYFSQVVLSRLLGSKGIQGSAVTGLIDEDNVTMCVSERKLTPPDCLPQKLRYVFAARQFERLVLPRGSQQTVEKLRTELIGKDIPTVSDDAKPSGPVLQVTTEINYASDLGDLSDITQVDGWRNRQYVRCPEIRWALHGPNVSDNWSSRNPGIQKVLNRLKFNNDAVVTFDDVTGLDVAYALERIDRLRVLIRPNTPPALSWAFIRVTENEQDARFMQLLWHIAGAGDQFESILEHPTSKATVTSVANLLNSFEPSVDQPSIRAPDILVLINTRLFDESWQRCDFPQSRPFMMAPILKNLAESECLHCPYSKQLFRLIGKTRIILLPEAEERTELSTTDVTQLPRAGLKLLTALSTFEWEFNQQMAASLLSHFDIQGKEVREALKTFEEAGLLRCGGGWYHIPSSIILQVRACAEKEEKLAMQHLTAGFALAPFLSDREFPSLGLDISLNPVHLHEVGSHLFKAYALLDRGKRKGWMGSVIQEAYKRLLSFAEFNNWQSAAKILAMRSCSNEAYRMGRELLLRDERANLPTHPNNLVTAAQASAMWVKQIDPKNLELRKRLLHETNELFMKALRSCDVFSEEQDKARLRVLTSYSTYLIEREQEREYEIQEYIAEAMRLLDRGVDGKIVRGDWFEYVGDRENDDKQAACIYALGRKWCPIYAQLWVKELGSAYIVQDESASLQFKGTLTVSDVCRQLNSIRIKHVLNRSVVGRRWDMGLQCLKELWGSEREILEACDKLRSHLNTKGFAVNSTL